MAGDVQSLTVTQGVEYVGGTTSRQVAICAVVTAEHNVYFEFRIPRSDFTATVAQEEAQAYAANIESLLTNPLVLDIQWWQDAKPSGYLVDMGTVWVSSSSGNSSLSIDVPWGEVDPRFLDAKINAINTQLNHAENE